MNSQSVSDFMSRKTREKKCYKLNFTSIVAYPQTDVKELARIMKDIKIDCLPVLFSPWDRKLVGIIEFNKISAILNE